MNKLSTESIVKFDREAIEDLTGYEGIEDTVIGEFWNEVFGNYQYMLVTGSNQTWQGSVNVVPTIIDGVGMNDFMVMLSDRDDTEYEIFDDHIEAVVSHHDGNNYYTVRPFAWDMLTKKQLYSIIKDNDLRDDFMEDVNGALALEPKSTYSEFLDKVDVDSIPMDFVKCTKNQNRSRRSK